MQPVPFNGMNTVLRAPDNWDAELRGECVPLPVMRTEYGSCVSAWRPDADDLAKLNEGGWIFMHVFSGATMPPIAVVSDVACPVVAELTCPVCEETTQLDPTVEHQVIACRCGASYALNHDGKEWTARTTQPGLEL